MMRLVHRFNLILDKFLLSFHSFNLLRSNLLDFDAAVSSCIIWLLEDRGLLYVLVLLMPIIEQLDVFAELLFLVGHLKWLWNEDLKPEGIVLILTYC